VEAQTPPEHEGTCDNTGEVGMRNTPRQCTQRILMILTFGRGFSSQSGEGGEHVRGVAACCIAQSHGSTAPCGQTGSSHSFLERGLDSLAEDPPFMRSDSGLLCTHDPVRLCPSPRTVPTAASPGVFEVTTKAPCDDADRELARSTRSTRAPPPRTGEGRVIPLAVPKIPLVR
jgi:hypothetical protein